MKSAPDLLEGIPIRFTKEEMHALVNLHRHLRKVCDERANGWQLEMIANVRRVNLIIFTCTRRGLGDADPSQITLPPA